MYDPFLSLSKVPQDRLCQITLIMLIKTYLCMYVWEDNHFRWYIEYYHSYLTLLKIGLKVEGDASIALGSKFGHYGTTALKVPCMYIQYAIDLQIIPSLVSGRS